MSIAEALSDEIELVKNPFLKTKNIEGKDYATSLTNVFACFAILGLVVAIFPLVKTSEGTVKGQFTAQGLFFGFSIFGVIGLLLYLIFVTLCVWAARAFGGIADTPRFAYFTSLSIPLFVLTVGVSHILQYFSLIWPARAVFAIGMVYYLVVLFEGFSNVLRVERVRAGLMSALVLLCGTTVSYLA